MDIDPCYRAQFTVWRYGLWPWWTFTRGDDLNVKAEQSDMVFIDTSHYLEHTLKEIYKAVSLNPRYIFLHDVNAPLWPDMKQAIEAAKISLRDYTYRQWDNCYGLGLFCKESQ